MKTRLLYDEVYVIVKYLPQWLDRLVISEIIINEEGVKYKFKKDSIWNKNLLQTNGNFCAGDCAFGERCETDLVFETSQQAKEYFKSWIDKSMSGYQNDI